MTRPNGQSENAAHGHEEPGRHAEHRHRDGKRPHRKEGKHTMWNTVIVAAAGAACGQFGPPDPGHPAPTGITGEIRSYARCLREASRHRFNDSYNRQDSERYAVARCRLLEPLAAYAHAPSSPPPSR